MFHEFPRFHAFPCAPRISLQAMFDRPTPRQNAYSEFLGLRHYSQETKKSISNRIGARVDEIGASDLELFCPHCGEPVHLTYTRQRFCDACRKPFFFFRGKLLTEEEAKKVRNPFTKEDVKSFRQKYRSQSSGKRFSGKNSNGTVVPKWQLDRFRRLLPSLECASCGAPAKGPVPVKPEKYWICPSCAAISVFDLKRGEFMTQEDYEQSRKQD